MAFDGEVFNRLGLPPYAGALARELQNLADGLTTLNTNGSGGGFTLHQGATAPADTLGDDGDWYLRNHRTDRFTTKYLEPGSYAIPTSWARQGPMMG